VAERKLRIATCSLAGCFGCHMSLLDLDERILDLAQLVEFDRTPLNDVKTVGSCDVGIVEGGICNAENVHVLKAFRKNCRILVAVGACAITGGVPAMRNNVSLEECFREVYQFEGGTDGHVIPNDPELPLPFDKVHAVHEIVHVDYFLPGCPPSPEAFWSVLTDIAAGRRPALERVPVHYD
jgi:NAD-reducing hydrogenase small subunit